MTIVRTMLSCSAAVMALAMAAPALADEADGASSDNNGGSNGDIIVTATKRNEKLREIAGGVAALTGDELVKMGAQEFKDYLTRTPGVAFNEGPPQNSTAVIRGVGTTAGLDQGQGTTGYFINEIALTEPGYAIVVPDIDAFDVARVEVLRGPQGSLFGSASLGGAINYVANMADASGIDAAAEGGISSTKNASGQLSYRAKAMVNVPIISDKLAVRFTATQRVDAGYIDNVGTGTNGSNDIHNLGLRGSIVWTPDADTKLTYLGLYYRTKADDNSYAQLDVGELARSSYFRPTEKYETQIHSLRLDHDFYGYNFTMIGAYSRKTGDLKFDYSPYYDYLNPGEAHTFLQAGYSDTYSVEARLASPAGKTFDWLVGATYIDTHKTFEEHLTSPGIGAVLDASQLTGPDEYYLGIGDTKGLETALFGEANLHFGPVTVTGGGRLFHNQQKRYVALYGYFYPGDSITPGYMLKDNGFAPKASIKWEVSPDLMFYSLASKGFRFGSPNLGLIPLEDFYTPPGTKSDSLWNYEVGTRLSLADRKVLIDLTAFKIDWKDIQVRLTRPDDFTYGANAGKARIKGVEASVSANFGGFSYAFNGTYLDAKIIDEIDTSSGVIPAGKRLPSSAKWRLSNTASYNLGGDYQPTVTLMHRYVSASPGYLNDDTTFAAYNIFDARASVQVGAVTVAAFINNIGDKRAVTFGYGSDINGQTQFYVRPRTFGLQANWSLR
ncbi:TonB-dependent receptor [Novosphingobium resinovorum]|uniref:TonB-dependent receptor n=1 Tax=Novosphingobium resinovorum TaxID=158500 RepID=UPI002ED598DE|nr:TonB-dependent receptor [Novosphingobium resinovorum]